MEQLTPLLSDSIRDVITGIYNNHSLNIAKDLIDADNYINLYNKIVNTWGLIDDDKTTLCEILKGKINSLITDEVRALSIRRDIFEISFTPNGKPLVYTETGNWSRENRQTGKPGRIIKKLLAYDYKERDIEIFSNCFKAELMNCGDWKIVSGSEICHWYNGENYYKIAGTLGNSCMRYCECQDYFKVYEDNARMLICTKDGKLLGRAIIWDINGNIYMDRVYVCMDYLEEQFIQYAMDNKWYIRTNQSLLGDSEDQLWLGPESNYKSEICPALIIRLKRQYEQFPYMDSFRHFDSDEFTISTICDLGRIKLSNTDGYWRDNMIEVTCCCCGYSTFYDEDDECPLIWSDYFEEYLCGSCATYNSYIEDYISVETKTYDVAIDSITNIVKIPRDIVESALVTEPNFQTNWPDDYFINIDGSFYKFSLVKWDKEDKKYRLIDE